MIARIALRLDESYKLLKNNAVLALVTRKSDRSQTCTSSLRGSNISYPNQAMASAKNSGAP